MLHLKTVLGFLVLQLLWCAPAASRIVERRLPITNKIIAPDGFNRSTVLAGGTFPGTTIRGHKGDRFLINVENSLVDPTMALSTSVHWHGIFQKSTNWADGASFVSQCPIVPTQSFMYDFRVTEQAGTFWYHSHYSVQYCDGLRGAMVIYDREDPHAHLYDVDDESTIITLADWYHQPAPPTVPLGVIPSPSSSILINGKGRYSGGPPMPLSIINVECNKRYRLRIVALSCDNSFLFSIAAHKLLIIEADGENTAPLQVDSLQIFAGQRYSVVVSADQEVGNYWVRAQPNVGRGTQGFEGGINSAILRYAGAPPTNPSPPATASPALRPLVEHDLRALGAGPVPGDPWVGGADVVITIRHKFDFNIYRYEVNGVSWESPSVPVLLQILAGASASELMPGGSVYALPRGKVVELSLPGSDPFQGGPHPFHLHGHSFHVVRSAGSSVYNYDNPVKRDVVSTGTGADNVTIRFVTDNAGPWFLHCHIDRHLEQGLAVVFAEDIPGTRERPSKEWEDLCPVWEEAKAKGEV
ncbi:laccase [Crassisporium funariophilum]|nr:laccase [Crassisporium funariophilum]